MSAPVVTVDTPELGRLLALLEDANATGSANYQSKTWLDVIAHIDAHTARAVAAAVAEARTSRYIDPSEIRIVGRAHDGKTPDIDLPIFGDGSKDGKRLFVVALPAPQPVAGELPPPDWWVKEMQTIWCATLGAPITLDMKRAANIAIKVASGMRYDEAGEWVAAQPVQQPASPLDLADPLDLVGWLRIFAQDSGYSHNDYADVMRQAAFEIERLTVQQPAAVIEEFAKQHNVAVRDIYSMNTEQLRELAGVIERDMSAQPAAVVDMPDDAVSGVDLGDGSTAYYTHVRIAGKWFPFEDIVAALAIAERAKHSVPAAGVQGSVVIGFPDPEAVFAMFCDREGFPSDGDMDEALRKAFYEGTKLGHPAPSILPDSGRDAALWDANAEGYMTGLRVGLLEGASILREVYVNHVFHTGVQGFDARCKEAEQVLAAKADAAHPAPSSDAAQGAQELAVYGISDAEAVRLIQTPAVNAAFVAFRERMGVTTTIKLVDAIVKAFAAHPANGAQAGGADKLDAERYRWLRNQDIYDQLGSTSPYVVAGQSVHMLEGAEVDKAVDAAILAATKKGGA